VKEIVAKTFTFLTSTKVILCGSHSLSLFVCLFAFAFDFTMPTIF
jgi:hypothetical protein